ncbi:unnamed protein product [Brachionus calyciflorus]|uniref:G-protein coupled receptors family 1 profile domain-containing protein n=1 Tax=Brachionus calyciflorus TaxID=104777 RepID=A0A813M5G3_9BILA|nr:unnamed protein product [Brachionus calyciflorus]
MINFENLSLNTNQTIESIGTSNQISLSSQILIGIACIIVICLTLIGNTLVVSVIIRFKRLKNATNYILLSLAITDITVTFLVMIPAMIQDVIQKWVFNDLFCKIYNAFDITCCTASILHLLLVAIDRYIAIFKPLAYKNLVRKWHVFVAVISVWTLSLCMSFIPIFLRLNTKNPYSNEIKDTCMLEANTTYAILSSSLSFFIPLVIMTCVYLRIFFIAKKQANAIAQIDLRAKNILNNSNFLNNNNNNNNNQNESSNAINNTNDLLNDSTIKKLLNESDDHRGSDDKTDKKSRFLKLLKQIKVIEKKRSMDTKAIKTLGIIMGIFIICWLPFFIMYVSIPLANVENFPLMAERVITWIGYVNSFINPIIYALTNKDFRKSYISTLKSISKKLCPSLLHKSFFGSQEDYFIHGSNSKSHSTINQIKVNQSKSLSRKCTFLVCSSKKNRSPSNISTQTNQIPILALDNKILINDNCIKDLSDIQENENSQLIYDDNNNVIYIHKNKEDVESSMPSKTVLKINTNGENKKLIEKESPESLNKNEKLAPSNNVIVTLNKSDKKLNKSSTVSRLIRNFSFRKTGNPKLEKKTRDRSQSNNIIKIRI